METETIGNHWKPKPLDLSTEGCRRRDPRISDSDGRKSLGSMSFLGSSDPGLGRTKISLRKDATVSSIERFIQPITPPYGSIVVTSYTSVPGMVLVRHSLAIWPDETLEPHLLGRPYIIPRMSETCLGPPWYKTFLTIAAPNNSRSDVSLIATARQKQPFSRASSSKEGILSRLQASPTTNNGDDRRLRCLSSGSLTPDTFRQCHDEHCSHNVTFRPPPTPANKCYVRLSPRRSAFKTKEQVSFSPARNPPPTVSHSGLMQQLS